MDVSQAKELKRLKEENGRLKRAIAALTLDKLILNEALSGKVWALRAKQKLPLKLFNVLEYQREKPVR